VIAQEIVGLWVHSGLQNDLLVGNHNCDNNLVDLCLEFNEVGVALRIFDEMLVSGIVNMWRIMIMNFLFYVASDMYRLEEKFNEHA